MRRAILLILGLLSVILAVGILAERAALSRAREAGVRWERLERGLLGRTFHGVSRGPVRADAVLWTAGAPRRVLVRGVQIDLADLGQGGGEGGGGGGGLPDGVEVVIEDLTVRYGERVLAAGLDGAVRDGAGALDGDGVHLRLPGPDGARAALEATRALDLGRLSGEVRLQALWTDPPQLNVGAEALTLNDPLLAPTPLVLRGVSAALRGGPDSAEGTLKIGGIEAAISLSCGEGCALQVRLPETDLAAALAPMAPLIPELARAEVRGTVRGEATIHLLDGELSFELSPHLDDLRVRGAVPRPDALRGGVFEYPVTASDGSRRLRPLGEGAAGWTSLREVSPILIAAVIAAEDAGFRGHRGYSPSAIAEALARNQDAGKVVRGGSTLTQQLAKNLFLDGSRTIQRKVRELLLAAELDATLGKERVLELYLNAVEWGPDFWGVEAACDRYFLRRPAKVLPHEAAFLAALLPNPRGYYKWWYLEGRPNRAVVADILERMAQAKAITKDEAAHWANEPLQFVPPPR